MSACKFQGTDCDGPGANEMCATCYGYMVGTGDAVKRLREMAKKARRDPCQSMFRYEGLDEAADALDSEGKGE